MQVLDPNEQAYTTYNLQVDEGNLIPQSTMLNLN